MWQLPMRRRTDEDVLNGAGSDQMAGWDGNPCPLQSASQRRTIRARDSHGAICAVGSACVRGAILAAAPARLGCEIRERLWPRAITSGPTNRWPGGVQGRLKAVEGTAAKGREECTAAGEQRGTRLWPGEV